MADRFVAIDTAKPQGEQLPEPVRTELLEIAGDLSPGVAAATQNYLDEHAADLIGVDNVTASVDGTEVEFRREGVLVGTIPAFSATWASVVGKPNVVVAVPGADAASIVGSEFIENTVRPWYGKSKNVGDVGNSFGWAGSPDHVPATTITADVTFPLSNATITVADLAQFPDRGSFTLGGRRVAFTGRSASSGAGNLTGCYSEATATGTVAAGTATTNTPTGFFAFTVYKRFGYDGRPVVGSTQGFGVVTSYRAQTLDDSAESGSFVVNMADSGSPQKQYRTVTGGEMTAQLLGNWHLPAGHVGALCGGGVRTHLTATDHAKNVIGLKVNPTVVAGGFMENYDAVYQTNTAVQLFGTLSGSVTLPQATIAVTGTFPPATPEHPVTVRVGCNSQGMGGTQVTYSGQSGGNLTGCTGGTGTWAAGSNVANFAYGVNVKDAVLTGAGFLAAASGWSGSFSLGIKGINDSLNSMLSLIGPTNAEIAGGLTQVRLIAGSGQTRQILSVHDTAGTQRVAIGAAGGVTMSSVPIQFHQTGVLSVQLSSLGFLQPGVSGSAWSGKTTAPGAKIYSGTAVPGAALIGVSGNYTQVGDLYIRTDGDVGSTIYRCTAVTGNPPTSVTWTAIL